MSRASAPFTAVPTPTPTARRPRTTALTRRYHVDFARCSAMRCPGDGAASMRQGTSAGA